MFCVKQRIYEFTLIEKLQVGHLLTQSDILYRYLQLVADADDHPCLGRAVVFGDGQRLYLYKIAN